MINVETSINGILEWETPKIVKEETKELDVHLTSSRKMNWKSIFSAENKIDPPIEETKEMYDKSLQMTEINSEQEIIKEPWIKNIKKYIEDMNIALKNRKSEKKNSLREMLRNKKISDRGYKKRKQGIEKWVNKEMSQIKQTKNMLMQGWMKASEIIAHLEKGKNKVFKKIEERRNQVSLTSQSSNLSELSFWRSNNSFGNFNDSEFSQNLEEDLNLTTDYGACNKLRRKGRLKHMVFKFKMEKNLGVKRQLNSVEMASSLEILPKVTPFKEEVKKDETSSESMIWEQDDLPKEENKELNEGYINKWVQDIKNYYQKNTEKIEPESSSSSDFNMDNQLKSFEEPDIENSQKELMEKGKF